jgi:hypothetical protein
MIKIILALLLFLAFAVQAQDITQLESQYINKSQQLQKVNQTLDSLQNQKTEFSQKINSAKSKGEINTKNLADWMEKAQYLSQAIERNEKEANRLNKEISDISKRLDQKYIAAIDSLHRLQNSENGKSKKSELEGKILIYSEKRFLISPGFKNLSFDPKKMKEINLADSKDALEYKIKSEYLTKAKSEIDAYQQRINQSLTEVKDYIRLREKTDRFLEEVNDDRTFGSLAQLNLDKSSTAVFNDPNTYTGGDARLFELSLKTQAQSLLFFLNNLSLQDPELIKYAGKESITSTDIGMTAQEYADLLKQTNKILKYYQTIIDNKLKQQ